MEGSKVDPHLEKLDERVSRLETRLAVLESNVDVINEKLNSIKNNNTWIMRLAIGSIITVLLDFIFKGTF